MQHPRLERIRELLAAAQDAHRPTSYARHLDNALAASPIMRGVLADYEQDLLRLDAPSWRVLKSAAIKRLIRNEQRGWEPLFGVLNEAKAYAYLAGLGCADIQMIPSSYEYKTPDLRAQLNGVLVLCEVKTINISDDARPLRPADLAAPSRSCLSEKFLRGKLTRTLRATKTQLDADPSSTARKIVYVVFTPDESLHEYTDDSSLQLRAFLKEFPLAGVEVEIFNFPCSIPRWHRRAFPRPSMDYPSACRRR